MNESYYARKTLLTILFAVSTMMANAQCLFFVEAGSDPQNDNCFCRVVYVYEEAREIDIWYSCSWGALTAGTVRLHLADDINYYEKKANNYDLPKRCKYSSTSDDKYFYKERHLDWNLKVFYSYWGFSKNWKFMQAGYENEFNYVRVDKADLRSKGLDSKVMY
ncbi:hypothetical protein [uncultured Bacteroides sp.]|uniref:hypothetical protein n=1 Tax=uncultured Bacteroides sp. TaxID=162156 RepID=UPI0025E5B39D|nr:hypothetical protein [uncultured Bacteroides sp.]